MTRRMKVALMVSPAAILALGFAAGAFFPLARDTRDSVRP